MQYNKAEILAKTQATLNDCNVSVSEADDVLFFKNIGEKWNIAENLVHLAKSIKSVNRVMALPTEQLILSFGKPTHVANTLHELYDRYMDILKTGMKAPTAYVPQITEGDTRQSVLEFFNTQHTAYLNIIDGFADEDLDSHQIPHPALGNLTLREMLYFNIIHIEHHRKTIQSIIQVNLVA